LTCPARIRRAGRSIRDGGIEIGAAWTLTGVN
jgi:hypothetical protein